MTVVWLRPGTAGGFECVNCLRDAMFEKDLRPAGMSVVSVPVYLPLEQYPDLPVFYPAIRMAIAAYLPVFRKIRLFDSSFLLRRVARLNLSHNPESGARLTEYMLSGRNCAEEDSRLADWLPSVPDCVLTSTTLLIHQGAVLAERFGCPLFSLCGGEDHWVDFLSNAQTVRNLIGNHKKWTPVSADTAGAEILRKVKPKD